MANVISLTVPDLSAGVSDDDAVRFIQDRGWKGFEGAKQLCGIMGVPILSMLDSLKLELAMSKILGVTWDDFAHYRDEFKAELVYAFEDIDNGGPGYFSWVPQHERVETGQVLPFAKHNRQ
jgi:hypothetical protein